MDPKHEHCNRKIYSFHELKFECSWKWKSWGKKLATVIVF